MMVPNPMNRKNIGSWIKIAAAPRYRNTVKPVARRKRTCSHAVTDELAFSILRYRGEVPILAKAKNVNAERKLEGWGDI
jgi:hypothetical protein